MSKLSSEPKRNKKRKSRTNWIFRLAALRVSERARVMRHNDCSGLQFSSADQKVSLAKPFAPGVDEGELERLSIVSTDEVACILNLEPDMRSKIVSLDQFTSIKHVFDVERDQAPIVVPMKGVRDCERSESRERPGLDAPLRLCRQDNRMDQVQKFKLRSTAVV